MDRSVRNEVASFRVSGSSGKNEEVRVDSEFLVMVSRIAEAMAEPLKWAVIVGGLYLSSRVWGGRRLRDADRGELQGVSDQLQSLKHSVDGLRGEMGEIQERLDFAERLLTRGSETAEPQD